MISFSIFTFLQFLTNPFFFFFPLAGKCGHGFRQERQLLPNLVRGALVDERVTDVSLGFEHSGCVTESGKIYTFGNNYYGRLGLGDEDNVRYKN